MRVLLSVYASRGNLVDVRLISIGVSQ